jgi:DNA mismatch repair protein MutS
LLFGPDLPYLEATENQRAFFMSTPLMQQYAQVKSRYPDTILLFRMGDFFETFDEDAKVTARVLGITLTRRGNGASGETPLAGFPHHALDAYLPKLLKAGHRVAICEQLEDPKQAKGIVKRDVIEVVTPGVAFSDKVLDQKRNNFLTAIALPGPLATGMDKCGLAFVDVSTGEFRVAELPMRQLAEHCGALEPAEILVQRRDAQTIEQLLRNSFRGLYTKIDDWIFNVDYGRDLLTGHFHTQSLKGFGLEESAIGVNAAGVILHYLQETQKANLLHIRKIVPFDVEDHIVLDPATKRNLEITSSIAGDNTGTLFAVLDRTHTAMGGRLLQRWIHQPLNRLAAIQPRLDAVSELRTAKDYRKTIAEHLSHIGDLERLSGRICTGRSGPRDLNALMRILAEVERLSTTTVHLKSPALQALHGALTPLPGVVALIAAAIEHDPPATLAEGGVIRKGYSQPLDDLRALSTNGKQWIAELQAQERERTGIPSLKVGFNNVFGYYIEITNTHKDRVPQEYIRKQTLTGAERYITPALKEYEEKILHAEERILALETELFTEVRLKVSAEADAIQANATALAHLDCFISLADVGEECGYVCPEVNEGPLLEIIDGRHPVIERLLPAGEHYEPNSVRLDITAEQILIITGPNMSGKSSYLRQTGLIVLLAQIGCHVPARKAVIGIVDKIFTRVGASDNIASGESTFLVEMHEAAHIVNTATARSLILLDEVGRGTSTFDGISIAWALTEYLHGRVGARTLFATHYHELNELADLFPRIRNFKVDVREYGDKIVFLHKVTAGFADHSYGIQVAQMAGLPEELTDRAKQILKTLEGTGLTIHEGPREGARPAAAKSATDDIQLTLFEMKDDALRAKLRGLDVNAMTPIEALKVLAALKDEAS